MATSPSKLPRVPRGRSANSSGRSCRELGVSKLGYLFAKGAFKALRDKLDPNKSNGGVFLGLNGIVVKSHGDATAEGFAYAVDVGYEMVHYDLLTKINQMLNREGSALAPTAQEAVS